MSGAARPPRRAAAGAQGPHALFAFALLAFVLFAGVPAHADEAAAWSALRQGGAVALMRHGDAPGAGDPPGWRLDDCATQRNLSEGGRAQARAVGARLRAERIAIDRVLSSPWCRCIDTATLAALGRVEVEAAFSNAFVLADQRAALRERGLAIAGRWRGPGVLLVVTHGQNILALTGKSPTTAEIVVVAPANDGTLREIGSIPPR